MNDQITAKQRLASFAPKRTIWQRIVRLLNYRMIKGVDYE